jgi:hypothetical protein
MAFFTFVYVDGHGRLLGSVVALYQMVEGSVNEEGSKFWMDSGRAGQKPIDIGFSPT